MSVEILVYILMTLVVVFATLLLVPIGLLAGTNMSPISFKQYWWYLPLVGLAFWGWKALLAASPFTVIAN